MSAALEKVAKEVGTKHITAVAIAYIMQKTPYVFPIIGGRKVEQLEANLESLAISLTPEQVKYLESIVPFEPGFPHNMIVSYQCSIICGITEISHSGRWHAIQLYVAACCISGKAAGGAAHSSRY